MKNLFPFFFPLIAAGLSAQSPLINDEGSARSLDEIRAAFHDYFDNHPGVKGKKQFDRWMYFMEPRVEESGEFPRPDILLEEWNRYRAENAKNISNAPLTANWSPWGAVPSFRVGRTQCLRFDPSSYNVLYLGTPSAGLWKSTDAGQTWNGLTDNLPILGVSDVAIDPSNSNIVYIACGDADAGTLNNVYSVGVMKSTDGGLTWSTTGLNWQFSNTRRISRLLINPDSTNVLIATTSNGIYRTRNGGTSWTQVRTGNHKDAEFMPGNSGVVYAASTTQVLKSVDGGYTWTALTNGLPSSGVNRVTIAVTPSNPNVVFAACAATSSFNGLYKSIDAGNTFSTVSTTGVSSTIGTFPWYSFTLAVSPVNENIISLGGLLATFTQNGGSSWSSCGTENDYHDMIFLPGSDDTLYFCNDKGIYRHNALTTSTSNISNLNNGLRIMMIYKMGLSAMDNNVAFSGTQDIATYKLDNTAGNFMGVINNADGGECVVNYQNPNYVYAEKEYGQLFRSTTGGGPFSFSPIASSLSGTGYFVTPFAIHTQNPSILYAGYDEVYKSTDQGSTWTSTSAFPGSTDLRIVKAAPSDGNLVFVSTGSNLWKTVNGGNTWTDLTALLPVTSGILDVCVHSTDTSRVWITRGGFTTGSKVFSSNDGGLTWTNFSGTLPNVPVNCMVHENNFFSGMYIGTDLGVWYRDNSMSDWIPYNTGLPVVIVNELEIQYSTGKIVAGTMGRGFWISYLYTLTVGTTEENIQPMILFPNPVEAQCVISLPCTGEYVITVYSMKGEIVHQDQGNGTSKISMDATKLARGLYLAEILQEGKKYYAKLVKN